MGCSWLTLGFLEGLGMLLGNSRNTTGNRGISYFQPRNLQKSCCNASLGKSRSTTGNSGFSSFSHAIFRKAVATQAWATHRTLLETGVSAVFSHAIFRKAVTMQAWETHETLRETGVSAAFQPRNLQKDSCIASMGNSRNTAGNRHFSSLQLPNLQKRYPGRS